MKNDETFEGAYMLNQKQQKALEQAKNFFEYAKNILIIMLSTHHMA